VGDQTQGTLPEGVTVVVDTGGSPGGLFGAARECREDNNSRTTAVTGGEQLPDLSLAVGTVTPNCATGQVRVAVTAFNAGVIAANGVVVQLFAGNPAQGGTLLVERQLDTALLPMSSLALDIDVPSFPRNRQITIWGAIDPNGVIAECNEGDNTDPADNAVVCQDLR
jgi:hypothetical protein